MIKVIIYGCNGKMGQVLTNVLKDNKDFNVIAGIDRTSTRFINNYPVYNLLTKVRGNADVIIDFSHPSNIYDILDYASNKRIPVVIATTGFSESELQKIKETSAIIPIFQGYNFSYGVSVITKVLLLFKALLNDYDIEIVESHHRYKVDAPSGTALLFAGVINDDNNYRYIYDRTKSQSRDKREIGISAIRGGTIPGTHTIMFAGEDELIEIKHTAFSKRIFAIGALKAAKFIVKQTSGMYGMHDLLQTKE